MKILDFVAYFIGACSMLALAAGYLGQLHPMFDSISVFRLHGMITVGIVVLFMVIRRSRRGIILFGAAFGIGAMAMLPYFLSQSVEGDITFMQSNLLFRNDANALAAFTQTV